MNFDNYILFEFKNIFYFYKEKNKIAPPCIFPTYTELVFARLMCRVEKSHAFTFSFTLSHCPNPSQVK